MLINRYIFRQTLSALVMILISLTLIVWLTSVLREIKLLTSQGQTFLLFLKITALAIPNLVVTVAPVAFLIAALHTLNRLNGDSELIVLSAAGASVWRLLVPYFTLAVLVALAVAAANHLVLPKAARLLGDYVSQVRADILSQVLQPGEFSDLEAGLTVHIRDKAQNGDLIGVLVIDGRDQKLTNTIIADRGEVTNDGGRAQMDLYDGQILRQEEGKPDVQFINFKSYAFDMGDFSPKTGKRDLKPRERETEELLFPDRESEFYRANKDRIRSEVHERLSTPLYSLVFAIVALAYLGRPKTTREGRAGLLFTAFIIGAIIRILGIAGINIVGRQLWGASLIYGAPLVCAAIGLFMLRFNIPAPAFALPAIRLARFLRPSGDSTVAARPI
ncbi:MAG TPA: LPS export ABC transporter permease LptF [Hyphomicrobiales bacterium]|nr:LPS export ABC transporter permease LptF [Hyphomicrobiales bacterium]